jgi:predicted HTH transcriptional regulator
MDDDAVLNYAAYLLADINGVSVKVAKYAGTDKYDLIENDEYGNGCLVTAAQRVLERLESENRTFARIAYPKRIERQMVDKTALREAVINAIVHNDYSLATPLVEIFSDRIVVTSAGGLVPGLSREDFFHCRSMPRNRVLMRVFRDVELVESLGSGMTRILRAYDPSIFELTPSFLVVTFSFFEEFRGGVESGVASGVASLERQIMHSLLQGSLSKSQIAKAIGREKVSGRLHRLILLLLAEEAIEYTIPEKPNSRLQKYRITAQGREILKAGGYFHHE